VPSAREVDERALHPLLDRLVADELELDALAAAEPRLDARFLSDTRWSST
jgi:hypothetical protein